MTPQVITIALKGDAKWITTVFAVYLVLRVAWVQLWVPSYYSLVSALIVILGGTAGLKASKMFGGRMNFTGRLILYFSLALFVSSLASIGSSLPRSGSGLSGLPAIIFAAGVIGGQLLSGYALLISVRALIERLDVKAFLLISFSLVFSLGFAWIALVNRAAIEFLSGLNVLIFAGLFPSLIFLQLASALLLSSLLGKWYATKAIGIVAYGYVGFSILLPASIVVVIALGLINSPVGNFILGVPPVSMLYVVSLGLTQVRPRTLGSYFAGESSKR